MAIGENGYMEISKNESIASKYFYQIFFLLLVGGIGLRFFGLDIRAVHHDESLYGVYSFHQYADPIYKFYKYNPLLHGPFLFNFMPWIYDSLGSGIIATRTPMAIMGSLLILIPLLFRRKLSDETILLVVSFLALSPTLIYWSKFLRHDPFVLMALALMFLAVTYIPKRFKFSVFFLGICFHACIKENIFVLLAILSGFLVYDALFFRSEGLWKRCLKSITEYPKEAFLALVTGSFIYCYFYSFGFVYPDGILDGLYRKTFSYWMEQHKIERIKGPFSFHLFFLNWYEPLFSLITLLSIGSFFFLLKKKQQIAYAISLGFMLGLALFFRGKVLDDYFLWKFFKLKIPQDIFWVLFLIFHSVVSTTFYIMRKERNLAFASYLFFSSFFTYSYLGEKVPWLSLYIIFPGLIYFCLQFDHFIRSQNLKLTSIFKFLAFSSFVLVFVFILEEGLSLSQHGVGLLVVLILGALAFYFHSKDSSQSLGPFAFFLTLSVVIHLRYALMVNFGRVNNDAEFIRQVHTTKEVEELLNGIIRKVKDSHYDKKQKILVQDTPIWPFAWYLKHIPTYKHRIDDTPLLDFKWIFDDFKNLSKYQEIKFQYKERSVPLRSWWVPRYEEMTLRKYLKYMAFHKPWNPPGDYKILYLERED